MSHYFWYFVFFLTLNSLRDSFGADFEVTCLEKCSITSQELLTHVSTVSNSTENVLCYQKCHYTKVGYLDEDGTVAVDKIMNDIAGSEPGDEEKNEKIQKCLEAKPKIVSLGEMDLMLKCLIAAQ